MSVASLGSVLRSVRLPLYLTAILCAIVLASSTMGETTQRVTISMLINVILVVGLYIFVGNSGIISFGHASFMAVGAYGTALVTLPEVVKSSQLALPLPLERLSLSPLAAAVVPAVVAAMLALLIGMPIMRLTGLSAAIATFSVLLIVFTVTNNWRGVTAGPSVLVGTPIYTTLSWALSWAALAIAIAYAYQRSASGLRLRGAREDERAARSLGVRVVRERVIAFTLSAFVVGIGGTVFAHQRGAFDPRAFYLQATFLMIVMLVIGGLHSLSGAVIGTIVVTVIAEGLRRIEEGVTIGGLVIPSRSNLSELGLGVLLLSILLARPGGVFDFRELTGPDRWFRRPPKAPSLHRLSRDDRRTTVKVDLEAEDSELR